MNTVPFTSYMSKLVVYHQRLGHTSLPIVKKALSSNSISYKQSKKIATLCVACNISKIHALSYFTSNYNFFMPLELLHSNVRIAPLASSNGHGYYVHFTDVFFSLYLDFLS